jgi:hypothetical protein
VTDGLSETLCVAEAGDTPAEDGGYWASGIPCVSHDGGSVNDEHLTIYSFHPGGAYAARLDGSVGFLADGTEPIILAALCTRAADDQR